MHENISIGQAQTGGDRSMTAEQQPSRYRCENWEIRKTKGDCPVFHIYLNNKYFAQTIDEYKADLIIGAFNIASHSDFQQPAPRFRIVESVPDKNNLIIIGIKEDPNGGFVSRNAALDHIAWQHNHDAAIAAAALRQHKEEP